MFRLKSIQYQFINKSMQEQQKPEEFSQKNKLRTVIINPPSGCHKHTIIWMHGLNQYPQKYLHIFESPLFNNFKVISLQAPKRFSTVSNKICNSWFDVKFRSQKSFKVDFDQAFSKQEVIDSFENYIAPIVKQARAQLKSANPQGKLIIAGFSQGCGMSLHAFFNLKQQIDAAIGLSGYLFPFTPVQNTQRFYKVLYGKNDIVRPWQYVKQTYEGRIQKNKIQFLENTDHEINKAAQRLFQLNIQQIFGL